MRVWWALAGMVCTLGAATLFGFLAPGELGGRSATAPAPSGENAALIAALRQRIKHVFVIYQENHSFDEYFGTYPGAENLATAQAASHGFRQYDPIGKQWVTPFKITDADIDSPAHSRKALIAMMDGGKADQYVTVEEKQGASDGYNSSDQERLGLLTMSHYDCDTIPILWKYAHAFTLYDAFFQGMTAPSTPGNIEIIAAQSGQTQRARDPNEMGDPILSSIDPAFGPYPEKPGPKLAPNQRYATVLLTLNGRSDAQATEDTQGVRDDLDLMANSGRAPVQWDWYQEGYADHNGLAMQGYQAHRNVVQYFGYMRHNGVFWNHVHEAHELFSALRAGTLPDQSVTYIKGGSFNHFGWRPARMDPFIQKHFLGDDDHPGTDDSDRQVAEAFVATYVNAIARSQYWKDSAIIVLWDDSGGFYDHVPSPQFEGCPDGHPCGDGPRLPFILISPYSKANAIVHDMGDTGSVVKFVNTLFDLPALSSLPDEKPYMPEGPRDGNPRLTDLTGAFDMARLSGAAPAIASSEAIVPDASLKTFPTPMNCKSIGMKPVSFPGASSSPPRGYAPLPKQYIP